MNEQNLMQNRSSTPEERRANAVKAGVASGEARRRRKQLRMQLSEILAAKPVESELLAVLDAAGLEATHEAAMCLAVMARAEAGDIEACRFVRDTVGERPNERLSFVAECVGNIDAMDLSQLSDEELELLADWDG